MMSHTKWYKGKIEGIACINNINHGNIDIEIKNNLSVSIINGTIIIDKEILSMNELDRDKSILITDFSNINIVNKDLLRNISENEHWIIDQIFLNNYTDSSRNLLNNKLYFYFKSDAIISVKEGYNKTTTNYLKDSIDYSTSIPPPRIPNLYCSRYLAIFIILLFLLLLFYYLFNYFKTKKCCEKAAFLIEKVKELEINIDKDLERIETLKFQNIENERLIRDNDYGNDYLSISLLWDSEDDFDLILQLPSGQRISRLEPSNHFSGDENYEPPYSTEPMESIKFNEKPEAGIYRVLIILKQKRSEERAVPFKIMINNNGIVKEIYDDHSFSIFSTRQVYKFKLK